MKKETRREGVAEKKGNRMRKVADENNPTSHRLGRGVGPIGYVEPLGIA